MFSIDCTSKPFTLSDALGLLHLFVYVAHFFLRLYGHMYPEYLKSAMRPPHHFGFSYLPLHFTACFKGHRY